MSQTEVERLQRRIDSLEGQVAMLASYTHVLIGLHVEKYPPALQSQARAALANVSEKVVASLLASDRGFSDVAIQGVENMRDAMFGKRNS